MLKINGKYVKEDDFLGKQLKVSKSPKQLTLFDSVEACMFFQKHLLDEVEVIEYPGIIQTQLDATIKSNRVIVLEEVVSCGVSKLDV